MFSMSCCLDPDLHRRCGAATRLGWAGQLQRCSLQQSSDLIYVDDPAFVAKGTPEMRRRLFTIALLWAAAAGYPLSWKKAEAGSLVTWIGAQLERHKQGITVTIPETKINDLLAASEALARAPVATEFGSQG